MRELIAFLVICFIMFLALGIIRARSRKKGAPERWRQSHDGAESVVKKDDSENTFFGRLERTLVQADVGITVPVYLLIVAIIAILIFLFVWYVIDSPILGVFSAFLAFMIPGQIVKSLQKKKMEEFENNYYKALKRMAVSLRTNPSVEQAIEDVARADISPRITQEFGRMLIDYSAEQSWVAAFEKMYDRTKSKDVRATAFGVKIHLKTGSDLSTCLDSYAESILTRREARADKAAKLAGLRSTTTLLAVIAFVFGIGMRYLQPDFFDSLYAWRAPLGKLIIVAAYAVVVMGYFILTHEIDKEE